MKFLNYFLFVILLNNFCSSPNNSSHQEAIHTTVDCNALNYYQIGQQIINKENNEHIWNLFLIKRKPFFIKKDYFTNLRIKDNLVIFEGEAGVSAGNASNLLLLLACQDTLQIVYAAQVGEIDTLNLRDLNKDGLKEIIVTQGMAWQGECNETYSINTFANYQHHKLFSANSQSFLACGSENIDFTSIGDTLENWNNCSIMQQNDHYFVKKIRTIKIHHGGKNYKEIEKQATVKVDTLLIEIKKS